MKETVLKEKQYVTQKKIFLALVMMLFVVASASAATGDTTGQISGITSIKQIFATVYEFFTSPAVRVIAIAGVIFTGWKCITNKGNPEALRPLVTILIACVIIGSASWFVEQFMGSSIGGDFNSLGSGWWSGK